eukprot:2275320-Rhodomonas_salina.2
MVCGNWFGRARSDLVVEHLAAQGPDHSPHRLLRALTQRLQSAPQLCVLAPHDFQHALHDPRRPHRPELQPIAAPRAQKRNATFRDQRLVGTEACVSAGQRIGRA